MMEEQKVSSNPILGIIGAIIGALLGAVIWVVLYQIGIIASLAGIAIAVLACKGYGLLGKRLDVKGAIIALLLATVVLVIAHSFCWGLDIYDAFRAEYDITLMDSILSIPDIVFTDGELMSGFIRDFAMGFVLILVGGVPFVKKAIHERSRSSRENMGI